MKLTKEKTDTIIVKASTTNEYVYCDFAVIRVNKDLLEDLSLRIKAIYKPEHRYAKYSISCPFFVNFFQESEEPCNVEEEFIRNDLNWSYLHLEKDEELPFKEVEDRLTLERLYVDMEDDFYIGAMGKWCDIIFETSLINIKDL